MTPEPIRTRVVEVRAGDLAFTLDAYRDAVGEPCEADDCGAPACETVRRLQAALAAPSAPETPSRESSGHPVAPRPDEASEARTAERIPGWEGTIGPFPAQYGKPHVYARDVHSGAGNCLCGATLRHARHVQAAPGVPIPGQESESEGITP